MRASCVWTSCGQVVCGQVVSEQVVTTGRLEAGGGRTAGYRTKNKNPTQRCGEIPRLVLPGAKKHRKYLGFGIHNVFGSEGFKNMRKHRLFDDF